MPNQKGRKRVEKKKGRRKNKRRTRETGEWIQTEEKEQRLTVRRMYRCKKKKEETHLSANQLAKHRTFFFSSSEEDARDKEREKARKQRKKKKGKEDEESTDSFSSGFYLVPPPQETSMGLSIDRSTFLPLQVNISVSPSLSICPKRSINRTKRECVS